MPHLEDPLLQAYLDGYCNDARVAEVETHLAGCEECRQRLEEARQVAARASQLLGALEPGPVHAPSFEELEAKAEARAGGEVPHDVAAKIAEAAFPKTQKVLRPSWRNPALAWAASLAIAFSLGWLSRTDIGSPALDPTPMASLEAVGSAMAPPDQDSVAGPEEQFEATGELDELEPLAKRSLADAVAVPAAVPMPAEEPADPPVTLTRAAASNEAVVETGLRAADLERRVEQQLAAPDPPAAPGRREAEAPGALFFRDPPSDLSSELDENLARAYAFAETGATGGYIAIELASVEAWLGAPPRQLPDLTLVRAEVGPGTLMDEGSPERPAVRLVYLSSNGEEIALMQQYLGSAAEAEKAASDDRADVAAERLRIQRPQAAQDRANRQAGVDRDVVVGGVITEFPLVVEPGGRITYKWVDASGYLLALSGNLDPSILRGLASQIR